MIKKLMLAGLIGVAGVLAARPFSVAGDDGGHDPVSTDSVGALAAEIDRHLAARWDEEQLKPSHPASDAEFLRRTYLNISGRIPSCSEVESFLEDASPKKRRRIVDTLLESPGYSLHLAETLRSTIVPEVNTDPQLQLQAAPFEQWLRRQLAANAGYDQIARQILTASLESPGPGFYFVAKGGKPENIAAGAARVFLGVRIECAECHNHPFARWRREQFWQFAAFFAGVNGQQNGRMSEQVELAELKIPGTAKVVPARYLDEGKPVWGPTRRPRQTIADWMVARGNPYFAKAAVNRIWAHFFGTGIVDPIDDFDEANPPSHPQLLDALASAFTGHDGDLKFLIRAICASRAYQLSSAETDPRQSDRRLFARAAVKGLTASELAASLSQAIGDFDGVDSTSAGPAAMAANQSPLRAMVGQLFKNDNVEPVEIESTILQALALMNSPTIEQSTAPGRGNTLGAVLESPFLDTAGRIETLYLSTLSRRPMRDEKTRLIKYVKAGGTRSASKPKIGNVFQTMITPDKAKSRGDQEVALGDVFWALLNSSEFLTNH